MRTLHVEIARGYNEEENRIGGNTAERKSRTVEDYPGTESLKDLRVVWCVMINRY